MADITQKLKTAIAAYAKWTNDEVKREVVLSLSELDSELNRLEYDPSNKIEERSEILNQVMMTTKELFSDSVKDKEEVAASRVKEVVEGPDLYDEVE